jgi:hypothetical protein
MIEHKEKRQSNISTSQIQEAARDRKIGQREKAAEKALEEGL